MAARRTSKLVKCDAAVRVYISKRRALTRCHGVLAPQGDPKKTLTLGPEAPGQGIREWLDTTSASPLFAAVAIRADIPILLSGNVAAQIEHALKATVTTDRSCLDHEKRARQTAEVARLRRRTRRYPRQPMMRGTVTMGGGYTVKLWSNPRLSTGSPQTI